MEGGKPPRDCKQSLRPYRANKDSIGRGRRLSMSRERAIITNKQSTCHPERRKTLAFCVVEVLLSE